MSQIRKRDRAIMIREVKSRARAVPGLVLKIIPKLEKVCQRNRPVSARLLKLGNKVWAVSPESPRDIISYSPPPPSRVANKPKNQRYLFLQVIKNDCFKI